MIEDDDMESKDHIKLLLNVDNWYDYNVQRGIYFGYKSCCIHYFSVLFNIGVLVSIVSNMLYGDVYSSDHVLCPRCRRKQNLFPVTYRYSKRFKKKSFKLFKKCKLEQLI
jgi:hypothetical protein